VRALGGTYLPIRNGMPTGFNPMQLPPTPANVEFLKVWIRALVRGSQPLSIREENDLDHALMGVLALDAPARRLSRLIEFTDATRAEGIQVRLARWCESTDGLTPGCSTIRRIPLSPSSPGARFRDRRHRVPG